MPTSPIAEASDMRYEVKAYRSGEGLVSRTLEAGDADEVARLLAQQGYHLITARPARFGPSLSRWIGTPGKRGAGFDLLLFTQQLHTLLVAGLSVVEALAALAEEHQGAAAGTIIAALQESLRVGKPLSAALGERPESFPTLYVALIAASERTGAIPLALERYIDFRGRMDAIRQQLVSAAIYPGVLLAVGSGVGLFLLIYVVPRFGRVYAELGGQIPLASRLMLELGGLLQRYGLPLLAALAMLSYLGIRSRGSGMAEAAKGFLLRALRWPPLAPLRQLYRNYILARFYRTLAVLLLGGLPLLVALVQARGVLDPESQASLERVLLRVRGGEGLSASLAGAGLAPPMVLGMLRIGESAGDLPTKLEHVSRLLDREVARRTDWLAKLIEPLLTLAIGLFVAFVVVLLYMPIFELAGRLE